MGQSTLFLSATLGAALVLCLVSAPLHAAPEICQRAAAIAAERSGVPVQVLRAISLTETGRRRDGRLAPWPWTVNMEGKGVWFDTRAEAEAYVEKNHARGARSYDVGCFQVNYRWHGQHFTSNLAMFDPVDNAMYAARFLSDLYAELGDWSRAAGAYHSRTPVFATKYRRRFDQILAGLDPNWIPPEGPVLAEAVEEVEEEPPRRVPLFDPTSPVVTGPAPLGSLATALISREPLLRAPPGPLY